MQTGTNTLTEIIRQEIENSGGQIPFARFMELALYHPQFGYYNAADFNLGKHGDFTTAPEISPLFARCFARQCQQILDQTGGDILELGAGTGRFACDLLSVLEQSGRLPDHYYIYEISHNLRQKQQTLLQSSRPALCDRVIWLDHLPTHFTGVIIANEVIDALPVTCFRIENDEIKERCIAWENNQFTWKIAAPLTHGLSKKTERIREAYRLYDGYESEINLQLPAFIAALANSLERGVILLADYGYGQREYYHPERNKGTLTCFYQHQRHDNPLIHVGKQDITAHADFTSVIDVASDSGCTLEGYTSQASFLLACGLLELAASEENGMSPAEAFRLHQDIKILTLPTEMGELVNVMALGKKVGVPLMGFRLHDKKRSL